MALGCCYEGRRIEPQLRWLHFDGGEMWRPVYCATSVHANPFASKAGKSPATWPNCDKPWTMFSTKQPSRISWRFAGLWIKRRLWKTPVEGDFLSTLVGWFLIFFFHLTDIFVNYFWPHLFEKERLPAQISLLSRPLHLKHAFAKERSHVWRNSQTPLLKR